MEVEKERFIVNVTESDIHNGIAGDGHRCPIALALNKATGRRFGVGMHTYCEVDVHGKELTFEVQLPGIAKVFRNNFDRNRIVDPFSFEAVIVK